MRNFTISLSLSLSLTDKHTHTNTHSLSVSFSLTHTQTKQLKTHLKNNESYHFSFDKKRKRVPHTAEPGLLSTAVGECIRQAQINLELTFDLSNCMGYFIISIFISFDLPRNQVSHLRPAPQKLQLF